MVINGVDSTAPRVLCGEATGSGSPEQRRSNGRIHGSGGLGAARPGGPGAEKRSFGTGLMRNTRVFGAKFASILDIVPVLRLPDFSFSASILGNLPLVYLHSI
jgi:hypothetical protein